MIVAGMRILFIGPKTFNYETEIKRSLENSGCHVDWYDDRPASTPLIKALIRFRPELISTLSDKYFDRITAEASGNKYDVVFVIKGEAISAERLRALRESQPDARFLYYTWDSLKNFKNGLLKLSYFDKAYSFDRFDSTTYPAVKHLPLFYLDDYKNLLTENNVVPDIDLLFLGSLHSDRYAVVQRIASELHKILPDLKLYEHYYYQSRWVFFLRKLFDSHFRGIPWNHVQWRSLNKSDTLALLARSKVVLDIHHPGQTGLTMRTIECLGARKKIITTNSDVMNYDFYCPENILIVDRTVPRISSKFFDLPYQNLPDELYERYCIGFWLKEIFS